MQVTITCVFLQLYLCDPKMKPTNVRLLGLFLSFTCASSLHSFSLSLCLQHLSSPKSGKATHLRCFLEQQNTSYSRGHPDVSAWGGTLTHGEILMLFYLFILNAHKRGEKMGASRWSLKRKPLRDFWTELHSTDNAQGFSLGMWLRVCGGGERVCACSR